MIWFINDIENMVEIQKQWCLSMVEMPKRYHVFNEK